MAEGGRTSETVTADLGKTYGKGGPELLTSRKWRRKGKGIKGQGSRAKARLRTKGI